MLIYGKQTVLYFIKEFKDEINTIFISKNLDKKSYNYIMGLGLEVKRIPAEYAQKISKNANHQGYLAEVNDYKYREVKELIKSDFVLVLVGITDMGNIGSILRSAYSLGINDVAIYGMNELNLSTISKTSSGAFFGLNLYLINNIYDIMNELKLSGFTLYGSDIRGNDLSKGEFLNKRALFVGSEDLGLGNRVIAKLDYTYKINMHNGFDSLNVSCATAIFLDRMRNE